MESFGFWDLLYKYLFPGWWIIPVYASLMAWWGTIQFWRRAYERGSAWASDMWDELRDGPPARWYAARALATVPAFVVALGTVGFWYWVGRNIYLANFAAEESEFAFGFDWLTAILLLWAIGGAAGAAYGFHEDGMGSGLKIGFWAGGVVWIPICGLVLLLLLTYLVGINDPNPSAGTAPMWLVLLLTPIVTTGSLCIAGAAGLGGIKVWNNDFLCLGSLHLTQKDAHCGIPAG